jgi:50S ribosomal protein L16 3-hydroxylase
VSETLLGGQSAESFLRRYWQHTPLLVSGAFARFEDIVDVQTLFTLAQRDDCESRLVLRTGNRWHVEHGPLARGTMRKLPPRGWTLLVQGVNHFVPRGQQLLERFSFVPYARLDDLMVSYAPPGGGVGPHFDSYDVFLLQGMGRRRWQVGWQRDLSLRDDQPLKLLKRFRAQGECTLQAGDMLYLPPEWAHDGVALEPCLTYSIGFRAPSRQELLSGFLAYLDEHLRVTGRYSDRGQVPARHPGRMDTGMLHYALRTLHGVRSDPRLIMDFLGRHLTEPKTQVSFCPADRLSPSAFVRKSRRRGLQLSAASRLLYYRAQAWINGERVVLTAALRPAVVRLADTHRLPGDALPSSHSAMALFYRWYREGYLELAG